MGSCFSSVPSAERRDTSAPWSSKATDKLNSQDVTKEVDDVEIARTPPAQTTSGVVGARYEEKVKVDAARERSGNISLQNIRKSSSVPSPIASSRDSSSITSSGLLAIAKRESGEGASEAVLEALRKQSSGVPRSAMLALAQVDTKIAQTREFGVSTTNSENGIPVAPPAPTMPASSRPQSAPAAPPLPTTPKSTAVPSAPIPRPTNPPSRGPPSLSEPPRFSAVGIPQPAY